MSFQFPADPKDGDIVVRGNLQAFYNAATNTWRVSEIPTAPGIPGPPGPPGPEGPEGKGLEISGSVATEADLPAPNTQQFKFWLVDDVNKVFYSDGAQWLDFGGPIQGPQGEPGENGNDGTNGQNGRGWYDTAVTDERPVNYQVTFLSNDGLTFTTDNIMGPKGDKGDLEPADEDTCGCIKLGRGLDIEPDGSVDVGSTYVDLETTPLNPQGEPQGGYILNYIPQYSDFEGRRFTDTAANNSRTGDNQDIYSDTITMEMPVTANAAQVVWFQNTNMTNNPNKGLPSSGVQTYQGMYQTTLNVSGAQYTTSNMTMNHFHHVACNAGTESILERQTAILNTKTNEIVFPTGGPTLTFTRIFRRVRAAFITCTLGIGRLQVTPFRTEGNVVREVFSAFPVEGDDEFFYPSTPEQILQSQADELRARQRQGIIDAQTLLGLYPSYIGDAEKSVLEQIIADLIAARDLPGTPQQISDYLDPILLQLDSVITFKYRFEP